MNILYLKADLEEVADFCSVALKNRLYVSGWSLNADLHYGKDYPNRLEIVLALDENDKGKPIGVAILHKENEEIQVFVRKSYRCKGIGKQLVASLDLKYTPLYHAGIHGSIDFYEKIFNIQEEIQ